MLLLLIDSSSRVTTACSGKTSYLVLGEDAGATKSKKAHDMGVKIINEDEFLQIIRDAKPKEEPTIVRKPAKKVKTEPIIKIEIKEIEVVSKKSVKSESIELERKDSVKLEKNAPIKVESRMPIKLESKPSTKSNFVDSNQSLWTVKYQPQKYSDIIGNASMVTKLAGWLKNWDRFRENDFKKIGSDELSEKRAVLISGPPGIGKTTTAHLVAKLEGWQIIEFNASDVRSKLSIEVFGLYIRFD